MALPAGADTATVVARVRELGADPGVHGILVQLPLVGPADAHAVLEAVPPGKDVDGFHPVNAGRLAAGLPGFVPCTPLGILELLRHHEIPLAGRHVVVLGRSNLVGRPLVGAALAQGRGRDRDASATAPAGPGCSELAAGADVLVCAIGRPELVTAEWVQARRDGGGRGHPPRARPDAAQRHPHRRRRRVRLGLARGGRRSRPCRAGWGR